MNKTEARQLMMKYLIPRIEHYGFEERGKGTEFEIVRKTASGEDVINGGFTDYNPIQQIIYGTGKRDNRIKNILLKLQKEGIVLSPPINRNTFTIGVSYTTLNGVNNSDYLPHMETEEDVAKSVDIMLDFLEGIAFPLLDNFEDLRAIDRMINGSDPWETDADKRHRFGGSFAEKRLIVAKLSGNPEYDSLIDFTYTSLERLSAESGYPFTYDRHDLTKPLPALIKMLETQNPIY